MAKRKKPGGNPAKNAWEPLTIGPAASNDGRGIGMAHAFYSSGGKKHWYRYREGGQQPAVACLAFYNRLYNGFALVFEDTAMHLSFKRNDRAPVRDWRHFQAIKNEVAGFEREAIEIFPPESMLSDAANEYHLWVLPKNQISPLGFDNEAPLLIDATSTHDHAAYRQGGKAGWQQRPWEEGIPTGLGIPGSTPILSLENGEDKDE
jgi:hypothetical protein